MSTSIEIPAGKTYVQQVSASVPPGDRLAFIVGRATEVIGNQDEAMRWLGLPIPALNYATPISLIHQMEGFESVLTALGRLEYGVL